MHDEPIYLDYAATTPVDPRVMHVMLPYFSAQFGNPSSLYAEARKARQAVDAARRTVARMLGSRPSEVIFTSGGTESDNAALRGVVWASRERGNHIITSAVEHHAVLHCCTWLERFGIETTYLPVDAHGIVDPQAVAAALRPTTVLISIMHANNEVGSIQPLAAIGAIARAHGIPFHTDAVQSAGQLPLLVHNLEVDLLSLSAHKFYGPKGSGVLFVRRGVPWLPQQVGGGQERSRRAGTENVATIAGLASALALAEEERDTESQRLAALRDRLIDGVLARVPDSRLNGHRHHRLPNNASFSFMGVDGESILLGLDRQGIAASSGSACTAGSIDPSHVLLAMGLSAELSSSALRLTLGKGTEQRHIDKVLEVLPGVVARQRMLTPDRRAAARS